MQDGTRKGNSIRISTESFSITEVHRLIALLNSFNIKTTKQIKGDGTERYKIYIKTKSIPLVRDMILPYMHPSILYKKGLSY